MSRKVSCPICGNLMDYRAQRCTHCRLADQQGEKNPNWRGGISTENYRYKRVYAAKWPEKNRARDAVRYAVKTGKLQRTPCIVCGDVEVQAHHWHGYDKAHRLDVIWLCRECHRVMEKAAISSGQE